MKNCTHCVHAKWDRTAAGKLHPSGDGRCQKEYKVPPLPASMYWTWTSIPTPSGGQINRKRDLGDHCVYYARTEA